jgi:hypothetical protein
LRLLPTILAGLASAAILVGGVDAKPPRLVLELAPDLDQRPPYGIFVTSTSKGRFRLAFGSAVDNVGAGPLVIVGMRPNPNARLMIANQRVRLSNGRSRVYRRVGSLRYVNAETHSHWHYQPFERYELRRPSDYALIVRDRKSGFCLRDSHRSTLRPVAPRPRGAAFVDFCAPGDRSVLRLVEGASVGSSDQYPGNLEGQYLDITDVEPGLYFLVHRVNPKKVLVEGDYENNEASLLIRITWPGGRGAVPRVQVLKRCERTGWCGIKPKNR